MDLGLYNAKYALRRRMEGALPAFRNVSPNAISWSLVPLGALMAFVLYEAVVTGSAWLFLAVALLGLARMFVGTLDGLVAVKYGKGTLRGELVNRIAPEIADAMLLGALAFARIDYAAWAIGAILAAWLTTFSGLLGAVVGKPTQSVGPVGQTDRLAAIELFALVAFLAAFFGWGLDAMKGFLVWCVLGGALTVALRLTRHLRAVGDAPSAAR